MGPRVHKLYLSAILDLYDRRIVSFILRDTNDSALVHETLDQALAANPDAHPLFHSDSGFQYTTRVFHNKLAVAGMTQSMSRVGKCIDNGPMEKMSQVYPDIGRLCDPSTLPIVEPGHRTFAVISIFGLQLLELALYFLDSLPVFLVVDFSGGNQIFLGVIAGSCVSVPSP